MVIEYEVSGNIIGRECLDNDDSMSNELCSIDSSDSDDDNQMDLVPPTTTETQLKEQDEKSGLEEFKRVSKNWSNYKKKNVTDTHW